MAVKSKGGKTSSVGVKKSPAKKTSEVKTVEKEINPNRDDDLPYLLYKNFGWTFVPRGSGHGVMIQNPLFHWQEFDKHGEFSFDVHDQIADVSELGGLDVGLHWAMSSAATVAMNEWIALWALRYTEGLDVLVQQDDGDQGDVNFFALLHLVIMVDQFAGYLLEQDDIDEDFKLGNSIAHDGSSLYLATALHEWGERYIQSWEAPSGNPLTRNGFYIGEDCLESFVEWAPSVFSKVLDVIQSPTTDARFKAFFERLATVLDLDHHALILALGGLVNLDARENGELPTLLQSKLERVLGVRLDEVAMSAFDRWGAMVRCTAEVPPRKSLKDLQDARKMASSRESALMF